MFALSQHSTAAGLKASYTKKGRPLVVNDMNSELVATYRSIQSDADSLVTELRKLAKKTSEKDFYKVRAWAPTLEVERAARMIYLNRTGFNGLYRVNSSGAFNVPYGRLTSPTVCNEKLLRVCSDWLARVEVREGPFASAVVDAKEGDVVYFDPPYVPLSTTSSFSKYAKDDFREFDQWALAGTIHGLIRRGVRVILSNSNAALTREIYGEDLDLRVLPANRSIGGSSTSRGVVEEVLGLSYPVSDCTNPSLIGGLAVISHHSPTSSVR